MTIRHEKDTNGTKTDIVYLTFSNCVYVIVENGNGLLEITKLSKFDNRLQIMPLDQNKLRIL